MKKAFLLANIMMVMAVSAQQRPQQGERSGNRKEQRERPTVDQQLKKSTALEGQILHHKITECRR